MPTPTTTETLAKYSPVGNRPLTALEKADAAYKASQTAMAQAQAAVSHLSAFANNLGNQVRTPADIHALLAKRDMLAKGHTDQDLLDRRNAILASRVTPPGQIDMGSTDVPRGTAFDAQDPQVQRNLSPDMLQLLARMQGSTPQVIPVAPRIDPRIQDFMSRVLSARSGMPSRTLAGSGVTTYNHPNP